MEHIEVHAAPSFVDVGADTIDAVLTWHRRVSGTQISRQHDTRIDDARMTSPPSERSFTVYRATAALLRAELEDIKRRVAQLLAPFRFQTPKTRDSIDSIPPPVPLKDPSKSEPAAYTRRRRSSDSPPPYSLSWLRTTVVDIVPEKSG
jgi:hypothetical protein